MTETMTLNMASFETLSFEEMLVVDGGINWLTIGEGLGIFSATLFAVACAPASAFVGAAYACLFVGSVVGAAAAGCYIGYGLVS